jgi:hypothetical protein
MLAVSGNAQCPAGAIPATGSQLGF